MKSYNGKAKDLRWHLPLIASCAIVFALLLPVFAFAEYVGCKQVTSSVSTSNCSRPVIGNSLVQSCSSTIPTFGSKVQCVVYTNDNLLARGIISSYPEGQGSYYNYAFESPLSVGGSCGGTIQSWSGGDQAVYITYVTFCTWECNNLTFDCNTCVGTSTGTVDTAVSCSSPSPAVTTVCGGKSIFETGDGNWSCSQCTGDETKACTYSGPSGTENKGICKAGTQTCSNGQWGACEGEVLPAAQETCGDNLDNNCDGNTDEGCVVCEDKDGDGYYGYNSVSCSEGNDCNDFEIEIHPGATEACNTIDDNCNGQKDETCMGGSCSNIPTGSSANPGSGNLYHDQTLFNTNTLGFTLSYNSIDNFGSPLGKGWTHNWNIFLFSNPSSASGGSTSSIGLKRGDGRIVYFRLSNGIYYPDPQSGETSSISFTNGAYILTEKSGTTYNFNASTGKITSSRDRNGNTTTLSYSGDNLVSITDPSGRVIYLAYDSEKRISTITDLNGNTYSFSYANDALSGIEQSAISYQQSAWKYTYDASGQMLTKTDPSGYTTTYNYDSEGKVISSQDPEGKIKAISYQPSANTVTVTEKDGGVWTYKYDPLLNVTTQKTDPQGNTTTYTYDSYKNLISTTGPDGKITSYTYDEYGNMASVTDTAGNTTSYTYNEYGQVTSVTDSEGNVTRYEYDLNGNQTAVIDSTGAKTQYQHDSRGNIIQITYTNGQKTQMAYDQFNNMISVTDSTGAVTRFTYDSSGNMLAQMDSAGNTTEYAYDSLNRLIKLIDPNGSITQYTYDAKGNRTSVTDSNLNVIQYIYNYKNQLTKVLDPLNGITSYEYGGTGCASCSGSGDKLTAIIDAKGNRTEFEYDLLGRLTKESDSLGKIISYAYDSKGNLTIKTDSKGDVINYAYDALNRLIKKTYPDGTTEEYRYDSKGNIIYAGNQWIAYNFVYDAKGRLISVEMPSFAGLTGESRTISYEYDVMGNRTKMITPEGKIATYKYDANNRLIEISSEGQIFNFVYDTLGRRIKLSNPNGTYTTYSYDKSSRLTELLHKDSKGSVINSFTYTHDKVGNRLTKTELDKKTAYSYDALYRLTQALPTKLKGKDKEQENKSEMFTYDAVGNRLTGPKTKDYYSYNQGNQLTSDRKHQYEYNANGNLVKTTSSEGITTYIYDYENRLIKVLRQEDDEIKTVTFKYDPFGRRIEKRIEEVEDGKVEESKTYNYVYDNEDIILEYLTKTEDDDEGKTGITRYIHGLGIDEPLAVEQKGNIYYYHADGLGSIIALTDKRQKIVQSYTYDSFGGFKKQGDKVKDFYAFAGRIWDEDVKLYENRNRFFDPAIGRFITYDPSLYVRGSPEIPYLLPSLLATPQELNPYAYAKANPIRFTDPFGLTVKLCSRSLKAFGNKAPQLGKFRHEFLWINGTTYGFTLKNDDDFPNGPGWIAPNDDWDVNYQRHDGRCFEIQCINEELLLLNIEKDRNNTPYYQFFGFNCQKWAHSQLDNAKLVSIGSAK